MDKALCDSFRTRAMMIFLRLLLKTLDSGRAARCDKPGLPLLMGCCLGYYAEYGLYYCLVESVVTER